MLNSSGRIPACSKRMPLSPGKRLGVAVTAFFLAVIIAWIFLVRFAIQHGDKPIPVPAPARSP